MGRTTGFSDYVNHMATESPAACVLDWGRRLEMAATEYHERRVGRGLGRLAEVDDVLRLDPNFGSIGAALFTTLRRLRNSVAHDREFQVSYRTSVDFARHAIRLQSSMVFDRPLLRVPLLPVDLVAPRTGHTSTYALPHR